MLDIVYVVVTLAFFGLMVLYVRACEHLGRGSIDGEERS